MAGSRAAIEKVVEDRRRAERHARTGYLAGHSAGVVTTHLAFAVAHPGFEAVINFLAAHKGSAWTDHDVLALEDLAEALTGRARRDSASPRSDNNTKASEKGFLEGAAVGRQVFYEASNSNRWVALTED